MTYKKIFNYLSELEKNNNREWFHETKQARMEATEAFNQLIDSLSQSLHEKDPDSPLIPAKNLTFKLNRDTRFSHDKSPYNPVFALISGQTENCRFPVGTLFS